MIILRTSVWRLQLTCSVSVCRFRGQEACWVSARQRAKIRRRWVCALPQWRVKHFWCNTALEVITQLLLIYYSRVHTVICNLHNEDTELWGFLLLQDGSAADPDLSGILSVCQRHPIHLHRHADASVGPPQGQNRLTDELCYWEEPKFSMFIFSIILHLLFWKMKNLRGWEMWQKALTYISVKSFCFDFIILFAESFIVAYFNVSKK